MKTINNIHPARALLAIGVFSIGSCLAFAETNTITTRSQSNATTRNASTLQHADKSFMEKAAKSGLEEVAISQAVAERTTNPQVKEFAEMMVRDHSEANTTLMSLAAARSVNLAPADSVPNKWLKRDDKDYDEDYIDKIISEHESSVKLFSKEAEDGKDSETVAFARSTLPKLQHHLERAKDLKKMLK